MNGQIWLALQFEYLTQALCNAGGAMQARTCVGCARHQLPLCQGGLKTQHVRRHMSVPPLHTEALGFSLVPDLFHGPPNVLPAEEVELPVRRVFP